MIPGFFDESKVGNSLMRNKFRGNKNQASTEPETKEIKT
jgi:hypothetical protein